MAGQLCSTPNPIKNIHHNLQTQDNFWNVSLPPSPSPGIPNQMSRGLWVMRIKVNEVFDLYPKLYQWFTLIN